MLHRQQLISTPKYGRTDSAKGAPKIRLREVRLLKHLGDLESTYSGSCSLCLWLCFENVRAVGWAYLTLVRFHSIIIYGRYLKAAAWLGAGATHGSDVLNVQERAGTSHLALGRVRWLRCHNWHI